jgi:outer membrane protein assembly factor BamD
MPPTRHAARRLPLLVALVALGALPAASGGCASTEPVPTNPLRYAEDARKAYRKALEAFFDRDWLDARSLFQEVKRKYPNSRYARLAELRLADIDFEEEKLPSAVTSFRAFAHDHRTDEGVPYARYQVCRALYNQISDTLLLPAQEERDQATAVDAYRELRSFLDDFPASKWTRQAQFMLVHATGRLVRHELYVARYYLGQGNFEPAAARIQYSLRHFQGSGLEPEAMVLLAETYLKMKKPDQAREVLGELLASYPSSPFSEPAKNFLARMDGGSGSTTIITPRPLTLPPGAPGSLGSPPSPGAPGSPSSPAFPAPGSPGSPPSTPASPGTAPPFPTPPPTTTQPPPTPLY